MRNPFRMREQIKSKNQDINQNFGWCLDFLYVNHFCRRSSKNAHLIANRLRFFHCFPEGNSFF
jgi:hypothetical protein